MGANGFSTAYRYLRQVASSADKVMTMVQGSSIAVQVENSSSGTYQYVSWRFECGALTFVGQGSASVPAAGFAVDRDVGF